MQLLNLVEPLLPGQPYRLGLLLALLREIHLLEIFRNQVSGQHEAAQIHIDDVALEQGVTHRHTIIDIAGVDFLQSGNRQVGILHHQAIIGWDELVNRIVKDRFDVFIKVTESGQLVHLHLCGGGQV